MIMSLPAGAEEPITPLLWQKDFLRDSRQRALSHFSGNSIAMAESLSMEDNHDQRNVRAVAWRAPSWGPACNPRSGQRATRLGLRILWELGRRYPGIVQVTEPVRPLVGLSALPARLSPLTFPRFCERLHGGLPRRLEPVRLLATSLTH